MLQLEWTEPGATDPDLLEFDAVTREGWEGASEITDHPVEQGADVTDNVRPANDAVTLEAVVTNQPILIPGTAMDGATMGVRAATLPGGGGVSVLRADRPFDRVHNVDQILLRLKDTAQLITVRASLRTEENVVIERYQVDRDAESGSALFLTLALRRVRIATTQRTNVAVPSTRRARRTQNRGAQPVAPVTAADRRSALARLADSAPGPLQGFARAIGAAR